MRLPCLLTVSAWVVGCFALGILGVQGCASDDASPPQQVLGQPEASLPDAEAGVLESGVDATKADVGIESGPEAGQEAGGPLPPSGRRVGANVISEGVEFRVWAPNAQSALVSGDFGGGQPIPLNAEAQGYFAAVVSDAKPGHRYHFTLVHDEDSLYRLDPRARQVSGSDGIVVDPGSYAWTSAPFTPPTRQEAIVYELHVGGFAGADESGTFEGLTAKLDYLQTLGINVIELMPANVFGGTQGWGYNPQAYFAPQSAYGTPDQLRRLVDEAHARGLAVILDVVFNHYDGWEYAPLRCFDGECPDNAGIYFFPVAPYATTPWGPRPNYSEPQVQDFLVDCAFAWMTEYRIDGFRWDSTSNIRGLDGKDSVPGGRELLERLNSVVHQVLPGALSIAEDLKGWSEITKPQQEGGFGFDSQWDGFRWRIVEAVVGAKDADRDMNAVRDAILGNYNGDPFQRLIFTENHDVDGNGSSRLATLIDEKDPGSWAARKRTTLAAGVLLTSPGIPMLFMGQEFLERGSFTDPPPPLDWSKHSSYGPIEQFYRDTLRLRRNLDGVSSGLIGSSVDVYHVNNNDKVIAYRRWSQPGDDVVVVANFGSQAYDRYDVGLPQDGLWHVRVNTDDKKYSTDFGGSSSADLVPLALPRDGLPVTGPIVLGSYSIVILSR